MTLCLGQCDGREGFSWGRGFCIVGRACFFGSAVGHYGWLHHMFHVFLLSCTTMSSALSTHSSNHLMFRNQTVHTSQHMYTYIAQCVVLVQHNTMRQYLAARRVLSAGLRDRSTQIVILFFYYQRISDRIHHGPSVLRGHCYRATALNM